MKRTAIGFGLIGAALLAASILACDGKPTEEACEQAVANIGKVTGQTQREVNADQRAAVRSCRAQSTRDTVACYAAAQTEKDLIACGGDIVEELRKRNQRKADPAAPAGSGSEPGTEK